MQYSFEHNDVNEEKWSRRASTYDKKRYDYFRFMQQALISLIKIKSPIYLLDLGCGTGWAVRYVARKMNENGKFVGIDISGAMIDKAKLNSIGLQNVEFYKANSEDLPFPNNYFETIICSNSFHHYLHPEIVLCEVKRILKPQGRINILDLTADDIFI